MPPPLQVTFSAGSRGPWRITRVEAVAGERLPDAERLAVDEGAAPERPGTSWRLRGATSNARYAERRETEVLAARQERLGRATARLAALIPIRKAERWWSLAQDERRAIFEERSRHIAIGLDFLPGVARRLHHARDLGEPFDFLTWFEFAPEHEAAFEHMLDRLRRTEEWDYVDRELDIRVRLEPDGSAAER